MEICKSLAALAAFQQRLRGQSLALVPTMGALHAGHLSLVRAAQEAGQAVLVSLFVNPAQFAPHEDLDTYPQTFDADVAALEERGVTALFAPPRTLMYPDGEVTRVRVGEIGQVWEGADRPHFFDGVATIVTKLLVLARAETAYFGEKDYQQLQVIRRLATDLLIPTQIIGCPTVRDAGGLALSSRNAYLSEGQRAQARGLYAALSQTRQSILEGVEISAALETAQAGLLSQGFERVAYLAYVDAISLEAQNRALPEDSGRLIAAATLGGVRLIDNLAV